MAQGGGRVLVHEYAGMLIAILVIVGAGVGGAAASFATIPRYDPVAALRAYGDCPVVPTPTPTPTLAPGCAVGGLNEGGAVAADGSNATGNASNGSGDGGAASSSAGGVGNGTSCATDDGGAFVATSLTNLSQLVVGQPEARQPLEAHFLEILAVQPPCREGLIAREHRLVWHVPA